jgi:uncharacterized protein YndB with AHSA1/START domain
MKDNSNDKMENKITKITVETTINASLEKIWEAWTTPSDIIQWNNASEDWHTTKAENDLKNGGSFLSRMEAKDGSAGFDFRGVYSNVEKYKAIEYTIEDGRKTKIVFLYENNRTTVTETFEAENENPIDLQKAGWQAILDNFKKYVELGK